MRSQTPLSTAGVGMARDERHFRERRHDIRRRPTVRNDVMDPRIGRQMLPQHFDCVQHDHHAIESRTASRSGSGRRMRGNTIKAEQAAIIREIRAEIDCVRIAGMPVEHRVNVLHQAGVDM